MSDHSNTAGHQRHVPAAVPRFRLWPPVAVGAPWLAGYGIQRALWPSADLGTAAAAVGWGLLAVFAVWNGWSLALFGRDRTGLLPGQATTHLLARGPYRLTRNPLYIGMLLLHVGGALVVGSLGALVTLPLAWAGLQWGAVLPEERYLRTQLGEPYEAYCRKVRRWV
jgi:protein-S-isoprenylcysteine O-methyltransferase Ste14